MSTSFPRGKFKMAATGHGVNHKFWTKVSTFMYNTIFLINFGIQNWNMQSYRRYIIYFTLKSKMATNYELIYWPKLLKKVNLLFFFTFKCVINSKLPIIMYFEITNAISSIFWQSGPPIQYGSQIWPHFGAKIIKI